MRDEPEPSSAVKGARIGIVGDYNPTYQVHLATERALAHAKPLVPYEWVPTEEVSSNPGRRLAGLTGVLMAPGSPYRSMEGALLAVRYARENGVPLLGTCGGFQHLVIEFARNVLGIRDADHEETNPGAPELAVTALACSLAGQEHRVLFTKGSRVASIYPLSEAVEPFFCSYGLSPRYRSRLESAGLRVAALDDGGEVRAVELAGHPFFIGTLYVPQARSTPDEPHPLVEAFVTAARERAKKSPSARLVPLSP
jgi:CTP synthase (UTP-ammonia lyase)